MNSAAIFNRRLLLWIQWQQILCLIEMSWISLPNALSGCFFVRHLFHSITQRWSERKLSVSFSSRSPPCRSRPFQDTGHEHQFGIHIQPAVVNSVIRWEQDQEGIKYLQDLLSMRHNGLSSSLMLPHTRHITANSPVLHVVLGDKSYWKD